MRRRSGTGAKTGPKPKSPAGRFKAQICLPQPTADLLLRIADDSGQPVTDLGAYLILQGLRLEAERFGLATSQLPIPDYLARTAEMAARDVPRAQPTLLAG